MNDQIFDLKDKVALVSGASSGLGAHFAQVLAMYGARVILTARRLDRLSSLADQIEKQGGQVLAVAMDVTSSSSVKNAFNKAEEVFGVVEIVSNNAGIADSRLAVDTEEESWDSVLDTNLKGVWLVAKEAGSRMIESNKTGSIINTASILGLRVAISQSSYSASKAAVIQLTKSLALEWARKNIRVNALCPGYFLTDMNESFLLSERGQRMIMDTPAQRVGQLDELTGPFLLLASDAGSFINGIALPVDGAHSLGNM